MSDLTIGSLFSGYGGLDLAVEEVFGARTVWHCENDPAASLVLAARWPGIRNLGDITEVDWATVPPVDIITAGFPCQDVSHAGDRAGLRGGTRSGLWARAAEAIDHLLPRIVVVENVRGVLSAGADSDMEPCPWCVGDDEGKSPLRALGAVLGDLAELGFDAEWVGVRASEVGAPHGRFRVFVVAWPAEDTDSATGGQRWIAAPGQASDWWARPDTGGPDRAHAAPDADGDADGVGPVRGRGTRRWRGGPENDGRGTPPDPDRDGLARVRWGEPDGCDVDGRDRADGPGASTEPASCGCDAWGQYGTAVHRWELTVGRAAPAPTELSPRGTMRLAPRAVEWMMGLSDGWVTAVSGLSRNDQLRILGNGVVPQQAAYALRLTVEGA